MVQQVPTLIDLQKKLLDMVLAAGERCGVVPVVHGYRDSPRLKLRVSTLDELQSLLHVCDKGALVNDPVTNARLSRRALQQNTPSQIRLWYPVIVHGRVIHGIPSGIDLVVDNLASPPLAISFPDPIFAETWLGAHLIGRTVLVDAELMQTLQSSMRPKQIDMVLTWVDDQDPAWRQKRGLYTSSGATRDATDSARFGNQNELLYALRGLFRYFDGLGQVYLVTDGQKPAFWAEFADRVILIDHNDIMTEEVARPTFNSHVIESCLHRISGLAPHYLYLNDDVIFSNAAGVSDFFDDLGRAKVFYSNTTYVPEGQPHADMLAADAAAINARALLAQVSNYTVTRKFQHCPIAINRSVMWDIEARFYGQFRRVRQNRFRSLADIAPSGSLYQHYALMIGQAVPSEISYRYLLVTGRKLPRAMFRLGIVPAHRRPIVICLNAVTGGTGSWRNQRAIRREMSCLFPPNRSSVGTNAWRSTIFCALLDTLLSGMSLIRSFKE